MREHLRISGGEVLLIDESYNANPSSMRAALSLLAQAPKGARRIAVLGDMLELGQFGPDLHAELSSAVDEAGVDVLYAAGPLMAHLWARTPASRRGAHAETSAELRDLLLAHLRPGDAVMIKGSLGSRMGPLAEAIRAAFPPVKRIAD